MRNPVSGVVSESPEPEDAALSEVEIEIDDLPSEGEMIDGAQISETEDGGVIVDLDPSAADPMTGIEEHDANLAEHLPPSMLTMLASDIIAAVEADKQSRAEWEQAYVKGMDLLGLKIEEKTSPFVGACGVTDPLMLESVIRLQATARAEILPAAGPVKTQVVGTPDPMKQQQAERVKAWMNYYLTEIATEYYPDMDQALFWWPYVGSIFKKVYLDPVLARPVAPYITPDNLIVDYTASDIHTAPRVTHRILMQYRDVRVRQMKGIYLDVPIARPEQEPDKTATQEKVEEVTGVAEDSLGLPPNLSTAQLEIYETHLDLDLHRYLPSGTKIPGQPDDLPVPYVVTVEKDSQTVLAIRRNWRAEDPNFTKRRYFVHHKFLPGFGFYGYGYAHVLGGSAKAATSIRRQLVDSGTLANFPGGLRVKGMKIEDNNVSIGPTEFREIDTGGMPINQAVMTLPYKEPSLVLRELLNDIKNDAKQLAGTAEIQMSEGREEAPVGTTVALLEASLRIQSSVMKRLHVSYRDELRLLASLFAEVLQPGVKYPFAVPGGEVAIMAEDFDERVDIVPVSDPNISSTTQRLMRAEAQLRLAQSAPQIHDLREAYFRMYTEMQIPDIDKLLPPPPEAQPADPVTENMAAMTGGPLKAAPHQDHESHIAAHMPLAQAPNMMAHISEHMALAYRQIIEQAIGQPLPPPGTPLPPQMENQIAFATAQATEKVKEKIMALMGQQGTDPNAIAAAQIKVEGEKVKQKASEADLKATTAAFQAHLKFTSEREERANKLKMARMKAYTDIADNEKPPPDRVPSIISE